MEIIARGISTADDFFGALIGYGHCEITAGTFAKQYPVSEIREAKDAVVIFADENGKGCKFVKNTMGEIGSVDKKVYISDGDKKHRIDAVFVENGVVNLATEDSWSSHESQKQRIRDIMTEMGFTAGRIHNKDTASEEQEYAKLSHTELGVVALVRTVTCDFCFRYSHTQSNAELRTKWFEQDIRDKGEFLQLYEDFYREALHYSKYFSG